MERLYITPRCGNCYRVITGTTEGARFFTCVSCHAPTLECEVCRRLADELDLASVMTCATCSIDEETDSPRWGEES
jgi:hypothetical protein